MALSVTLNSVTFSALEKRRESSHSEQLPNHDGALFELPLEESKDRFSLHPSAPRVTYLEASIYLELNALQHSAHRSELARLMHMGARIDALELAHIEIDKIKADPQRAWEDGPFREEVRLSAIAEALDEWIKLDQQLPPEKKALFTSPSKVAVDPLLAMAQEVMAAAYLKKNAQAKFELRPSSRRAQFGSPMWGNQEFGLRLDPPHEGLGHGPGGDRLHLDIQCVGKKFRIFHCADGCIGIFNLQTYEVHTIDLSNPRIKRLAILLGNNDSLNFMGGRGGIEKVAAKHFSG